VRAFPARERWQTHFDALERTPLRPIEKFVQRARVDGLDSRSTSDAVPVQRDDQEERNERIDRLLEEYRTRVGSTGTDEDRSPLPDARLKPAKAALKSTETRQTRKKKRV
jgi:hypothetical protein